MARLLGPDANGRLVYIVAGGILRTAVGKTATVYADSAGAALANIATYDGTATPGVVISGSTLTVDTYSLLPLFWFPDGVDTVWVTVNGGPLTAVNADYDARLDASTTTVALAAHEADTTNIHGIANTAALETTAGATAKVSAHAAAADPHGDRAYTDTGLAGKASTSHGHDSTYVRKAAQRIYSVLDNTVANAAGDNTTDDAAAFNALVVALNALYVADGITRAIYVPTSKYLLRSGINWLSGVSLIGDGPGLTILRPYNAGPLASGFSAIYNYAGRDLNSPLVSCTFRDFEIDGAGITTTGYDVGSKGINILWMSRARFHNLYIHDCHASGIGCDHLQDSWVTNCLLVSNGRQNDGTQGGGAGIGIGTGDYSPLALTIANCTAKTNATHGIFVEHQHSNQPVQSKGIRIVGCHAEGNKYGISDWGADGLIVADNTVLNNTSHGVYVHYGVAGSSFVGKGTVINGNVINGNTGSGVCIDDCSGGRILVRANRIGGNSTSGVAVQNTATSVTHPELTIENNSIFVNGYCGVDINAPTSDLSVARNRVNNNGTNTGLASPRPGVRVNGAASHPTIVGNRVFDNQGVKTQTHGVYWTSGGTNTNAQVEHNDLTDNLTGAMQFDAAVGSGAVLRNNNGYSATGDSAVLADVQTFVASGTWTKPTNAKSVTVLLVAAGGGGGSGRRGAAGSVRCGGGGGGGGGTTRLTIPASAITSPVTVTVGTGGGGGAAITANDTDGATGTAGGGSTFGTYGRATGGGAGGGGTNASGAAGGSGTGISNGGAGGAASGTGGAGGASATSISGATGGGAAGGITSGDAASNGGNGSASSTGDATTASGGVAGGAGPGAGSAQPTNSGIPGGGAGGGASSTSGVAQAGGAGGIYGAGGGGGGASVNGNNSGAGGAGANGICVVTTYF